jgi:hypothetical protein
MKFGKILIFTIMVCILVFIATYTVTADDEQEIFEDPRGDVIVLDFMDEDYNYSKTDIKPNIDIKKLTYNHLDGSTDASVILEVYGEIEDKGSLDETSIDALNSVIYTVTIETSDEIYSLSYANKQCQLSYLTAIGENITGWTVNGGLLTIPFNLKNSNEMFVNMNSDTLDVNISSISEGGMYVDMVPDEITADANGPSEGKVGDNIEFSGEAYDVFGTTISVSYNWDFGDGETSSQQNPNHIFDQSGVYIVNMTVNDDAGNTAYSTTEITIMEKENGGNSGNGNGGGSNNDDSDSGMTLFFVVIVIIIIIGVIALILIIRR